MLIVERLPRNSGIRVTSSSGGVARGTLTVVRVSYRNITSTGKGSARTPYVECYWYARTTLATMAPGRGLHRSLEDGFQCSVVTSRHRSNSPAWTFILATARIHICAHLRAASLLWPLPWKLDDMPRPPSHPTFSIVWPCL
ncbi:hypothetical protein EDD17DRAFT_1897561 [Pisolithus thermaeus]|nr:hypothetical protein EDD17DRAFT_1897561 [Pisolithus thermaeus]